MTNIYIYIADHVCPHDAWVAQGIEEMNFDEKMLREKPVEIWVRRVVSSCQGRHCCAGNMGYNGKSIYKWMTGWWFGTCFFPHDIGNNHSN